MAVDVVVPRLGMTMEEATLLRWLVSDGADVRKGQLIFEAESEKISFEGEAEADGVLRHVAVEGTTVPAGGTLAYILEPGEEMPSTTESKPIANVAPSTNSPQNAAAGREGSRVAASPVAKRLASELGVDLTTIAGTGPGGRIVEADVRSAAQKEPSKKSEHKVLRRLPLRGARQLIGARMLESQQRSAQFTLYLDVDVTAASELRRNHSSGQQVATADLIVRAVALALKKHPRINATIEGEEILELADINIGIAVALPDGLIVPVIPGADQKDLAAIANERAGLAERARSGSLAVDDVSGSTFTVSVLGLVDRFDPIINPPEAAILGVGRTVQKPVALDGKVVVRPVATLCLTVDHRLVDGEPAAKFLREVGRLIEHPDAL